MAALMAPPISPTTNAPKPPIDAFKPVAAVQATTTGYNPVTQQVNSQSLVKNQLNDIIDPNNPLMQRAKTRALQQANKRGLLNSSMAVGASEAAMIDAAMPIAQQDAKTEFAQQSANQQVQNKAVFDNNLTENDTNVFNAESSNKALMFNSELASKNRQFDAEQTGLDRRFNTEIESNNNQFKEKLEFEKETTAADRLTEQTQFDRNLQQQTDLKNLEADISKELDAIDQGYKLELEEMLNKSKQAANMDTVQGNIYQQLILGISDIVRSPDFTQEEAQVRIDSLIATSNASLTFSDGLLVSPGDAIARNDELLNEQADEKADEEEQQQTEEQAETERQRWERWQREQEQDRYDNDAGG